MDGTILIADDDRTIRTILTQAFSRAGCRVHATASLITLRRWVDEGRGDLIISDVVMPDGNGLDLLPEIAGLRPGLPVIVISAQNTIMTAIKATEAQAYDYLPKPFDLPDLMKKSARALASAKDRRRRSIRSSKPEELPLVGRTPRMQEIYRVVARILQTDMPVVITGENGTGKSLIARTVHDFSDRASCAFAVATAGELEDADFAHKLLSRSRAGSVVLDEIGDLSLPAQGRLARILDQFGQDGPRLLATTQVDLAKSVAEDRFRGDLFYRISTVSLDVPPLRARIDDVALLCVHFLDRHSVGDEAPKQFQDDAIELMRRYAWPGNVRQLENTIRRLIVTSAEETIGVEDVAASIGTLAASAGTIKAPENEKLSQSILTHLQRYFDFHGDSLPPAGLYGRILQEMEVPLIEIALDATHGNQAKCAELLGINRNTLRKKINELEIHVTRGRKLM